MWVNACRAVTWSSERVCGEVYKRTEANEARTVERGQHHDRVAAVRKAKHPWHLCTVVGASLAFATTTTSHVYAAYHVTHDAERQGRPLDVEQGGTGLHAPLQLPVDCGSGGVRRGCGPRAGSGQCDGKARWRRTFVFELFVVGGVLDGAETRLGDGLRNVVRQSCGTRRGRAHLRHSARETLRQRAVLDSGWRTRSPLTQNAPVPRSNTKVRIDAAIS